ncbi:hypothetical protein DESHY_30046 [Desulforamulus hydrothermalis Lam5 = DSM 18033]|uniref:Uncharacterized protein n=2 Tax=Desulforamulus TaxID=2916693 RepID=K8EIB4_9FIRM|nr:hypothetical protein [Desulforamulus hydrothermalis]CCO08356.1 hypothetical protein DESHY_30046 [Desulforamulus hydrothermalis Lam5 = DSM 18033]SHH13814.1 hypothetical protein SAMN02745177_01574 [Desulforamulus hydrothermalis Lam5 = DSM 18033]
MDKHYRWFMIPFGSGLRTDSTMIRYGRHWGRLKRAILARFGWRPRPVGATPMAPFAHHVLLPVLRQVADRGS